MPSSRCGCVCAASPNKHHIHETLPKGVSVLCISKLQAVTNLKPSLIVLRRIEVFVPDPGSPHFSHSISNFKIEVLNAQVVRLLPKRVLDLHS